MANLLNCIRIFADQNQKVRYSSLCSGVEVLGVGYQILQTF